MTVSPSSRPLDSGTRRCQQASSSAATEPSALRYITTCLPQIVRGSSAGFTSASQAAAYQAFIGKGFVTGLTPKAYGYVMYTIAEERNGSRTMACYDTVISHRVYKPVPLSFPRKRGIQYSAAVVGALNGRHGVLNHPLS